jgi:hypothetical protein
VTAGSTGLREGSDLDLPADSGGDGATVGTCFGYRIRSNLPFLYLRDGGDGTPLVVEEADEERPPEGEPLMEWDWRPRQDYLARLYVENGEAAFWTSREGTFSIRPEVPAVTVPPSEDLVRREMRLWGIPTVLCFVRRGDLSLHAASVDVDGSAVLLAAPGRFGKTTLASGFLNAGYRLLSEDVSCLRPVPEPMAFPGPMLLRLRKDVHDQLDLPGTRPVLVEPDRVHLTADGPKRGDGNPVPIRAVVFLRAGEGPTALERVEPAEGVPDLWALSWKLPTDADRSRCFRGVASLAGSVPIWNLRRELRIDQLPEVVDMIVDTCLP